MTLRQWRRQRKRWHERRGKEKEGNSDADTNKKRGSHSLHVDEAILLQPINIQGGYNCGQRTEKANRTKKREKKMYD